MPSHRQDALPARRQRRLALALSAVLVLCSCTPPGTAARISMAAAPAQLTNVPDHDLCHTSVTPTALVQAERDRRGLGDCTVYRKTFEEEYNLRNNTIGNAGTLVIWAIMAAMAARDAQIVSSPACPFDPSQITGTGALTSQRKPGCPRHTYDKP